MTVYGYFSFSNCRLYVWIYCCVKITQQCLVTKLREIASGMCHVEVQPLFALFSIINKQTVCPLMDSYSQNHFRLGCLSKWQSPKHAGFSFVCPFLALCFGFMARTMLIWFTMRLDWYLNSAPVISHIFNIIIIVVLIIGLQDFVKLLNIRCITLSDCMAMLNTWFWLLCLLHRDLTC